MITDRVRAHSPEAANKAIDELTVQSIQEFTHAPGSQVSERIEQLDQEWDIERVLQANAAVITLGSAGMALLTGKRRWMLPAAVVPAFLLQHAIQGWCPPVEIFRRLGIRTRQEIDSERTALKAVRGDFAGLQQTDDETDSIALWAYEAAKTS